MCLIINWSNKYVIYSLFQRSQYIPVCPRLSEYGGVSDDRDTVLSKIFLCVSFNNGVYVCVRSCVV